MIPGRKLETKRWGAALSSSYVESWLSLASFAVLVECELLTATGFGSKTRPMGLLGGESPGKQLSMATTPTRWHGETSKQGRACGSMLRVTRRGRSGMIPGAGRLGAASRGSLTHRSPLRSEGKSEIAVTEARSEQTRQRVT